MTYRFLVALFAEALVIPNLKEDFIEGVKKKKSLFPNSRKKASHWLAKIPTTQDYNSANYTSR